MEVMDYDPITICVYYGASIVKDYNGYNYEGNRSRVIRANLNIKFDKLKRKLYSITRWSDIMYNLRINEDGKRIVVKMFVFY